MTYIIVLNYNLWMDTLESVKSLLKLEGCEYRIVIVDNYSANDSSKQIKKWIEENRYDIKFIQSEDNRGYSAGNNLGIKYALEQKDCRYVWVLNNDTVVKRDALFHLINKMKEDSENGIVGSKLLLYGRDGIINGVGGRYNKWFGTGKLIGAYEKDEGQYDDDNIKMDYVSGTSMLIKREVFEKIGLLSEDYFLYYEETDIAIRCKAAGYKVKYSHESVIYHKEGASIGSSSIGKAKSEISDYYGLKSRLIITKKFFPKYIIPVYIGFAGVILNRIARGQYKRVKMIFDVLLDREFKFRGNVKYVFKSFTTRTLMHIIDFAGKLIFLPFRLVRRSPANRKILVARVDQIGDVIQIIPFIKRLHEKYPDSEIHMLVTQDAAFLMRNMEEISKVHVLSTSWFYPERSRNPVEEKNMIKELKKEKFDTGYELRGNIKTIYYMKRAGVKDVIGYNCAGGEFMLSVITPYDRDMHEIDKNLRHIGERAEGNIKMDFVTGEAADKKAADIIAARTGRYDDVVIVHPFTRAKSKIWGYGKFKELIDRIKGKGRKIFVIGSPGEKIYEKEFSFDDDVINCIGRFSLLETISLIKQADIFIGNDSGPQYFAAYSGVKTCVAYGYTVNIKRWTPKVNVSDFVYESIPVDCGPCELSECNQKTHKCMNLITVDMIYEKIKPWIEYGRNDIDVQ